VVICFLLDDSKPVLIIHKCANVFSVLKERIF